MSEQRSAAEVVLEVFEAIESEFSIEPPIPKEITNLLHSRFTALVESERSRARAGFTYPHMCRDGHPEIGHSDNSSEMCPLCRARAADYPLDASCMDVADILVDEYAPNWCPDLAKPEARENRNELKRRIGNVLSFQREQLKKEARADVAERDKLLAEVRRQADQLGERYRIAAAGPGREFTAALVCGIGDKVSEVVAELVEALKSVIDAPTSGSIDVITARNATFRRARAALAKHSEVEKV